MHSHPTSPLIIIVLGLATGLLFVGLSIPLILGRIPRNPWYGFRVPKTLASDRVWYPANRYLGQQMFKAGRLNVMGSLVLLLFWWLFGLSTDVVSISMALLLTVPMVIAIVRAFQFLKRL